MYRPNRSVSYQCALVGLQARHLRQSGSVADIFAASRPSQWQERVRCGLKVVKSPAICTKRPSASSSTEQAEFGQSTVIRVPFCTSDEEISRKTLGSRRTGSISKMIR